MSYSYHINRNPSVSIIMAKVLFALLPAIVIYSYFYGIALIIQLGLATAAAWGIEYASLKVRGYKILPFLLDGSATVTAWLLALSFPPLARWWMIILACIFAIGLVKHLYGGIGNNVFNPAMVGFAVILIAFPAQLSISIGTSWSMPPALSAIEQLRYIFTGELPVNLRFDAIASATPLDLLKTHLLAGHKIRIEPITVMSSIALAYLIGGLFLLQQRVIVWHIPTGMLLGIALIAAVLYEYDAKHYASPAFHLLNGGTMLGAFFITTDPVTAPASAWGRFIFAFLVGILTYLIRVFGGFPDGVAFAILIMNCAVPFMDQYIRPPIFGRKTGKITVDRK